MQKRKRKKLCVAICIPVLERIEPQTDVCIEALRDYLRSKDIRSIYIQKPGIRLIQDARNLLIHGALSCKDVTHILFIDSDMLFMFNVVYKWLDLDLDIIGGSYVGRGIPTVPWIEQEVKPFPYVWRYDEVLSSFKTIVKRGKGVEKIKGGFGLGLTLINRKVFSKLGKDKENKWFDFGKYTGEDMYFFKSCIDSNIEVYVDWDAEIGHIGQKAYKWNDFCAYTNTQEGMSYIKSLEKRGALDENR